jgi:carboxyl-terminal processing protease
MSIWDRRRVKIAENTLGQHKRSHRTVLGSKFGCCFARLFLILFLILLLPASSIAENLTCSRLPVLMKTFLASHYAIKKTDEEIRTHAVDQMIKILDPSKTLLYESDLVKLKSLLKEVFPGKQEGNCASLQKVYDLIIARAQENENIIKEILGPDFRLDDTAELNLNIKKRSYLKTTAEKHELLRKVIQFQIETSLLAGLDLKEAKKQQIHRYELQTKRVKEHNPEKLITSTAQAFALALDPHTSYLSPEDMDDFRIQMQLSLEGIGATLSSDNGFTIIEELVPGGGAEHSGMLRPKDKIIAVAQEGEKPVSIIDMDLRSVVKMIRGKKGTQVTLTILRQGERAERFEVVIKRDKIDIKEQAAKISYETRTSDGRRYLFGVIDLPSFYGDEEGKKSCYEDVKNLVAEAKRRHVDGIVLDLSRNGGGLLVEAVRLAGLFIGNGGIVATKDNSGRAIILANGSSSAGMYTDKRKIMAFPEEDPQALYTGPLVVLTSRMSASASEIVAGALKDYHRAVIVGTDHTFGKGSVQQLMNLPLGLGGMKVTTGLYFQPGGQSTQKMGVGADVRLPSWSILDAFGEKELDYPLPVQEITPFLNLQKNALALWKPLEPAMLVELSNRSKVRVAKDEKFAEIARNNQEASSKQDIIRIADLRKETGKKNETAAELKKKIMDQYAPFVKESVNILLDSIMLQSGQRT